jgi:hypothetical protein
VAEGLTESKAGVVVDGIRELNKDHALATLSFFDFVQARPMAAVKIIRALPDTPLTQQQPPFFWLHHCETRCSGMVGCCPCLVLSCLGQWPLHHNGPVPLAIRETIWRWIVH